MQVSVCVRFPQSCKQFFLTCQRTADWLLECLACCFKHAATGLGLCTSSCASQHIKCQITTGGFRLRCVSDPDLTVFTNSNGLFLYWCVTRVFPHSSSPWVCPVCSWCSSVRRRSPPSPRPCSSFLSPWVWPPSPVGEFTWEIWSSQIHKMCWPFEFQYLNRKI